MMGNRHPGIPIEVARFARSGARQEDDSVSLQPDPHGDAVRAAVGQQGGDVRDIRPIQQGTDVTWQIFHRQVSGPP